MSAGAFAGQVHALREAAGLSRSDHVALVRVEGADAFDLVEHASTRRLYLREGQVRHTLLLRDDASVFADAYIGSGDDGLYVLAEGPGDAQLAGWLEDLRRRRFPGARADVRPLSGELAAFGIDGPYAWEVAAAVLGPAVLGMPYLTLLRRQELLCLRAGKTGEYGYLVLCPRAEAAAFEARVREAGEALGLASVEVEALDACALENGHFSMRMLRDTALARPLTPIELQLQWRVAYDKDFAGAEALRARRAEGPRVRTTCFTAAGPVSPGQTVCVGEAPAGEILAACLSPTLGTWVGSALVATRYAHPHVPLAATTEAGPVALETRTTPLVDNRSLHVDPHKHSFATREAAR